MSVVRIVFMGTPEFARFHLASLLKDSHYEIAGVISQPDRPSGRNMKLTPSPVKQLALEHGLHVITPESVNKPSVLFDVQSWRAEAAVVVAYGQIVSQNFLDLFPRKVVNVHGSLLPRWRGAAPIQRAIEAGDSQTGVSLQVMVKKMDAGAVIGSYSLSLDERISATELHDRLLPLGAQLLAVDLMDYLRGNLSPIEQDEAKVTYAKKLDKSESRINWQKTAREIHNHVRAFTLGPGSYCRLQQKQLKVSKTFYSNEGGGRPGVITKVNKEDFFVSCAQGSLQVLEVQPESRPKMSVKDFLLGHKIAEGTQLE